MNQKSLAFLTLRFGGSLQAKAVFLDWRRFACQGDLQDTLSVSNEQITHMLQLLDGNTALT